MSIYATISQPITADLPCGPDPELDPEIQNFLAVAEGQLPASYREFNRKTFDAKPALEKLQALLAKSRDLRFLILSAKFSILSDNLTGFVDAIAASNELLHGQWGACHPNEQAGGSALRAAYLKTLDDLPTVVLPLQNATLISDKRLGQLTWRSVLLATKKLAPREGENVPDMDTIKDALMRYEPAELLGKLRVQLEKISASLQKIRDLFVEKAGFEVAPHFDQLPELAQGMGAFLNEIITARNPGESHVSEISEVSADAAPSDDIKAAAGMDSIASVKEASNALEGILAYYSASEPSSPARLLVKQARQLVGKSFVEAMRVLAPGLTEASNIKIGGEAPFTLDFAQLSALVGDDTSASEGETEARQFTAKTRGEATALMRRVEQFYKITEPSSPIPLLVEKARNFVAKDFTALLKEMVKRDEPQT